MLGVPAHHRTPGETWYPKISRKLPIFQHFVGSKPKRSDISSVTPGRLVHRPVRGTRTVYDQPPPDAEHLHRLAVGGDLGVRLLGGWLVLDACGPRLVV